MKPILFFAAMLLWAPPAARAEAEPLKESHIFYFDNEFRIVFELAVGMERTARSTDTFKIENVATEVAYTDGARFVIEKPQDLSLDELNKTTWYAKTGEIEAILGGKSVLVSSDPLPPALADLITGSLSGYFTTEKIRADVLTGVTPQGRRFKAAALRERPPGNRWHYTINMTYSVDYGGKKLTLTESCFPRGMSGFSRYVKEQSLLKNRNLLLSLGLGGSLLSSVLRMPAEKAIERLAGFGTDIAALHAEDIKYLWEESRGRDIRLSTGGISFICSNLEIKDAGLAGLVKPYAIKELNGVRIAFISFISANAGQFTDPGGVPLAVAKDPADAGFRSTLVEEIRGRQKAKLVVAVSYLTEDLNRLLEIPGIDVVIGPKSWEKTGARREEIALDGWEREMHQAPAAFVVRDSRGLGEITLGFSESGALKTVRSRSIPLSAEDTLYDAQYDRFKEKIIRYFFGSTEALLPDARRLHNDPSNPKVQYSQLDFKNIVVSVLREKTGAEIAFMKIEPFTSSVPGDIPVSMVRSWLGQDDKVATAWVPGSLIRSLMPKFDFKSHTGGFGAANEQQKYMARDYFAVSGLEPAGRISGLPVKDGEFYLAAFPAALLRETGRYPRLKDARIIGYAQKAMNALVLESLEKIKNDCGAGPAWPAAIKKLLENRNAPKTVWRLNIRNLSLQMNETSVRNTANFSQVSDSRLRTSGQTYIQGSGSLFSEVYHGNLRFDSGLSADYGEITLRPENQSRMKTESLDRLVLESEARHQFLRYDGFFGPMVLGPFLNLAYDTEFTRQGGLPRRKIVRGRAGLKLFEGASLRELYAGMVTEQEYTYYPARTRYAAEAGFSVNMPLPGTALTLAAEGNYRNFARSRLDTAADLKQRLELNLKLSAKLYGDIMISPFFNFFLATGKLARGTAVNIMTGISFNYSKLFKLKY